VSCHGFNGGLDSPKVDEDQWLCNLDIRKSFVGVLYVLCLMREVKLVAGVGCARGLGSSLMFRRARFADGFSELRLTKGPRAGLPAPADRPAILFRGIRRAKGPGR